MKLLRGRGERVGASYFFDAALTRFAELMDGGMHMMNDEVSEVIRVVRITPQQSMGGALARCLPPATSDGRGRNKDREIAHSREGGEYTRETQS